MSDFQRLQQAIALVIDLLRSVPGRSTQHWAAELSSISERLADPYASKAAIDELERCFGGMGSLNDLVFDPMNQNVPPDQDAGELNTRFGRLLDTMFRELRLVGAGSWARLHWRLLELVNRKNLPPRILKAFAGGGAA
jgi:hypothetical protein